MEELLALQRQLASLQNVSTQNRLSDRIVVDLIDKLVREYDLKVFNTTDGQTLITPNYLSQMVHNLILQTGRLQIGALAEQAGVSFERLEAIVVKDSHQWKDVIRVQDELMSDGYLFQLCEQIDELLQQQQEISLSELVSKYNLPLNFFKTYIFNEKSDKQGIISGILTNDKLTTMYYLDIMKARLRGTLIACIKPISINQLAKEYQLDENLAYQITEQLIRDNEISGKLQQGQFIPNRFLRNQESITKRFFNQNHYIEYEMLTKQLNVQKPKEFLKTLFKDNFIPLESCGFNKQAILSLKDQISELLLSEGYTDLQVILPTVLKESDIQTLLFKYMEIEGAEYVNSLIFSHSHIDQLAEKFKPKIIETIYKQPQKLIEQSQKEEEEISQASAGGFSKKKSKNVKNSKPQKTDSGKSELFSEDEIFDFLVSQKIIEKDDALPELYQLLCPKIQKLYEQIKVDLFENKKSASSELIQGIQNKIEEIAQALSISVRSIDYISTKFSSIDIRLLVDNTLYGYRLLIENMVILICKKYGVQLAPNLFITEDVNNLLQQQNQPQNTVQIDCALHKVTKIFKNKTLLQQAIESLPKDMSKFLKDLFDMCIKKQLSEVHKQIMNNSDKLGIRLIVDKKVEKNFFYHIKYTNKEIIRDNKFDSQLVFNKMTEFNLADKFGIYFVGNHDEKLDKTLSQILFELVSQLVSNEQQQTGKKQEKNIEPQLQNPKEFLKLYQTILQLLEEKKFEEVQPHLKELLKLSKI